MAVKYDEVEILGGGIKYDRPSKGSFALNLVRRHGAWEVRQGFGQLAQYDTRITNNVKTIDGNWGYQKHLGSYVMQTDFGHEQIISVFKARVYTSEVHDERAQIANIYVVSIYDTTTRERWEEPLYRHTSESGLTSKDNHLRKGHYETNRERDYQAWLIATSEDTFSFAEVRDTVYFGSPGTHLYAYTPCTFRGNRRRFVSGAHDRAWAPPYSESSMVWRVQPSPGADIDVYGVEGYRTSSGIPSPQALITWGGRLVIAGNDREVFFSQKDMPTAYIDLDVVVIPTEGSITAMAAMGQSIYVFTETETFFYQPATRSGDPLASQGMEAVLVSDTIGCVSQSCVTKTDNAVIWVSSTGVHVSGTPMDIQTISDPIAPFFTDFLTDPMTTFFAAQTAHTGSINTRLKQRNSVITPNMAGASAAYSEKLTALLVTLPEENVTLCHSGGEWSMWTYQSNTGEDAFVPDVGAGAIERISYPWLLCRDQSLYLVGSVELGSFYDQARYAGTVDVDDDATSRSAYLLEYGRGGAIDRSVDDEDERTLTGKFVYYATGAPSNSYAPILVLGEWLPVEQQYKFQGLSSAAPTGESAPAAPNKTFLVPVYIVPGVAITGASSIGQYHRIRIRFFFDATKWRPVFDDATTSTDINLIYPPERMASSAGWVKRKCEDGAGAAARNGLEINLEWLGSSGGHNLGPAMNVAPNKLNLLCYIPMMTIANADVSGMGITQATTTPAGYTANWCEVQDGGVPAVHAAPEVLVWRQWRIFNTNKEDNVSRPVDWAYMSEDVGLPEDARVKGRGVSARLLSHGVGTDVTGSWTQSIFNTMLAADLKTWTPQVLDYLGNPTSYTGPVSIKSNLYPTAEVHNTLRDRVQDGAGALIRPTYGSGAVYGNEATQSFEANTYLIGDEQVDEITTSESMKGNSVAMMLFGFMRNPAERLKLESVKLLFRIVGVGRRRRGR
jgi:hypothetical protein